MPTSDRPLRTKLLRKPRAPPPLPSPPPASPTKSYISNISSPSFSPPYMHYERLGSTPSYHPGVVSPPPPSEFYPQSIRSGTTFSSSLIQKSDLKYVLDPKVGRNTQLGTYIEGQSLSKPYKPRGPDGLPARIPRSNPTIVNVSFDASEHQPAPPDFTLQDFIVKLSEVHRLPIMKIKQVMYSKNNYKRLQQIISQQLFPAVKKVHQKEFTPPEDMPTVTPRVPEKQLLVEIAALIKSQMADSTGVTMKSIIRPVSKYPPGFLKNEGTINAQIVLYEESSDPQLNRLIDLRKHVELPNMENICYASDAKYFQGSRRSQSPFTYPDSELITPAELAVLDSLMSGGTVLSLKANFISSLPDVGHLANTLTYVNLSFNNFQKVPLEILEMRSLQVLKMRNNPLTDIPEEIGRLKNLQILVFSFCLITELPLSLFALTELRHLDLSYNKLTSLPNQVKQLQSMKELNLEGNQLFALPCGALSLNLSDLRVKNNFMHPLLWEENSQNQPQRLTDLAALAVQTNKIVEDMSKVTEDIAKILTSYTRCETCTQVIFGPGMLTIRPVTRLFGIKNLPFLFLSCSPQCRKTWLTSEESLSDLLNRNFT